MPCRKMTLLISRSMDEPLGFWERWQLRFHLMVCLTCARFRRQMQFLTLALRAFLESGQQPQRFERFALSTEARQRIQRALEDELG